MSGQPPLTTTDEIPSPFIPGQRPAFTISCAWTGPAQAGTPPPGWTAFQNAVAHDDKAALAEMIHFPAEWENLEVRSIPSRTDFIQRFASFFTPEVKKQVASAKAVSEPGGYSVNWKGRGQRAANSYALVFRDHGNGVLILDGLYEGPRD